MKITVKNKLILSDMPPGLMQSIIGKLTIPNPKYLDAVKMGRYLGNIDRQLRFYKEAPDNLILPRGFIYELWNLCREYKIKPIINDDRKFFPFVNFKFHGQLRQYQTLAVNAIDKHDFGVLEAPTGSGKTAMALYIIARRKQSALIVVHTKELLNQWVERIQQFLGIQKEEIGIIGNGKKKLGEQITVAMVQSLYKCADEVKNHIGHVIVDECHRVPSRTFNEAISAFDCKFILGLSATVFRNDGLSQLIGWYLGDVGHQVDRAALVQNGSITSFEVVTRETDFDTLLDCSRYYSKVISELCLDDKRNQMISQDVAKNAGNGSGVALVLSDRKSHCMALYELIRGHGVDVEILTGDMKNADRQEVIEKINNGSVQAVVATSQLISEGFDCAALSLLFLATPIKFSGRLTQSLGRVLRPAPGKNKAKVYDYVDRRVGVLLSSANARQLVYNQLGA